MGDLNKRKNICRLNLIRYVLIVTIHYKDKTICILMKIGLCAIYECKDLVLLKLTLVFPVMSVKTEIDVQSSLRVI